MLRLFDYVREVRGQEYEPFHKIQDNLVKNVKNVSLIADDKNMSYKVLEILQANRNKDIRTLKEFKLEAYSAIMGKNEQIEKSKRRKIEVNFVSTDGDSDESVAYGDVSDNQFIYQSGTDSYRDVDDNVSYTQVLDNIKELRVTVLKDYGIDVVVCLIGCLENNPNSICSIRDLSTKDESIKDIVELLLGSENLEKLKRDLRRVLGLD